ncbi:MAG: tetratricopeptide repeat protein, partial [Candidatus Omnitrophica bacterium]|nr:tetratricopeptide repeat protein [Candidatus Omnitrophota bacterium]
MNRIFVFAVTTVAACLFSFSPAYGSSFGDIFGGEKAQEYKVMLEEKEQECQLKLEEKDHQYQQLLKDGRGSREAVQGMRDKNTTLMEAYEKIKKDQETVVEQLKRMRRDNQQCDTIKSSYNQMTSENEAFLKEKQSLEQRAQQLSTIVENLKLHLKEVTAEKDQLAVFLAEAQEDEDVKIKNIREKVKDEIEELKKQVNTLMRENGASAKQLEESQKEFRLSKMENSGLTQEIDLMRAEVEASEKQYEEIKKENRYLAQEATQFPKKFADLARHNRKLVKETADMHYNLGVSNIKSKEYGRAIKEFEKVLELKPQDAYANYN